MYQQYPFNKKWGVQHLINNGIMGLHINWYEARESSTSSNLNIACHNDLSSNVNVHGIQQDAFIMVGTNMGGGTTPSAPPL